MVMPFSVCVQLNHEVPKGAVGLWAKLGDARRGAAKMLAENSVRAYDVSTRHSIEESLVLIHPTRI